MYNRKTGELLLLRFVEHVTKEHIPSGISYFSLAIPGLVAVLSQRTEKWTPRNRADRYLIRISLARIFLDFTIPHAI